MSFFVNYTTKPEKSQEVKLEIFPKKKNDALFLTVFDSPEDHWIVILRVSGSTFSESFPKA